MSGTEDCIELCIEFVLCNILQCGICVIMCFIYYHETCFVMHWVMCYHLCVIYITHTLTLTWSIWIHNPHITIPIYHSLLVFFFVSNLHTHLHTSFNILNSTPHTDTDPTNPNPNTLHPAIHCSPFHSTPTTSLTNPSIQHTHTFTYIHKQTHQTHSHSTCIHTSTHTHPLHSSLPLSMS